MLGDEQRLVLVTGAAGVMGIRLVSRLLAAGWRVRGFVLPGDPMSARLAELGCEVREGDIRDRDSLRGVADGVDTLYHLAAIIIAHDPSLFRTINLEGTAHVVDEARRANVRHFIYVSSASVTYPRRTPYADSKLAAEDIVRREPSFQHTIVRPTLVYDENGGQELVMFRRYLERFPVVPFIGDGRGIKRPVWSGDIVDGLARMLGNAATAGKVYNLSGAEPIAIIDFARLILQHRGARKPFVRVPVFLCRALAQLLRLFMRQPPLTTSAIAGIVNDANLDPGLAMADLGYRPVGVTEGFGRCFPIVESLSPVAASAGRFRRTASQHQSGPEGNAS